MDYLLGPILNINVQAGPDGDIRRTNYNLCDFDSDPYPIIKTDGTPLFTDEEIETIEAYDKAKKDYNKVKNDEKKTQKVKDDKLKICTDLVPTIKPLMERAIEYVKENACDLNAVCGYHEWSPELTQRVKKWIDNVLAMRDPKTAVTDEQMAHIAAGAQGMEAPDQSPAPAPAGAEDLPF